LNPASLEVKLKNADGLNITAKGTNPHKGDITGSVSNVKPLS